jgi:hypothetical protein
VVKGDSLQQAEAAQTARNKAKVLPDITRCIGFNLQKTL